MAEYVLTATKTEARAGSFYDRIARLYDFTFKINGYGRRSSPMRSISISTNIRCRCFPARECWTLVAARAR